MVGGRNAGVSPLRFASVEMTAVWVVGAEGLAPSAAVGGLEVEFQGYLQGAGAAGLVEGGEGA